MIGKLRYYSRLLHQVYSTDLDLVRRLEDVQLAIGRLETREQRRDSSPDQAPAGFKVFSQWNEDGIIQWLLQYTEITNKLFVEFGVGDYKESNTRFLLRNDNWKGLVLDCDLAAVEAIRRDSAHWGYSLTVRSGFVTRENINATISSSEVRGDIGLLSIDIDGNDYWVMEAISCISPRIIVCEYNSMFPPPLAVSIPYSPKFRRDRAHRSLSYWGASLSAFHHLARARGYSLVATNSARSNAFFVRDDVRRVAPVEPSEVYRRASFREARDDRGRLLELTDDELLGWLGSLPLVNVVTGATLTCASLAR